MFINRLVSGLMIYGLLTSPHCGLAQTANFEESSSLIFQESQKSTDVLENDSIVVYNQTEANCSRFKAQQLILPGVFIAVGTFGVYNRNLQKVSAKIKNGMDNLRGDHFFRGDDYIQYLPALSYLTFGEIGIKSKHNFKERLVVEATSYIAMTTMTNIGKYSFKEKRPDSNARNSFPSGHTATVFTGAELMREEYGLGIGIGAYAVATGVAFLRLYNGRHWLNDVIAGVGIGILSARIGYWMLPFYQKWFKWDCTCSSLMTLLPAYNYAEQTISINFICVF